MSKPFNLLSLIYLLRYLCYFYLPAIGLFLTFCSHPDSGKEFIGPSDHTTPEVFSVVGDAILPAYKVADLQMVDQYFKAQFSAEVSWTLTITGLTSGAIKIQSGTSSSLSSSNTFWGGDSDSLTFFREGETCMAILRISGKSKTYQTHFVVSKTPIFDCIILDDFESPNDTTGFLELYQDEDDKQQTILFMDSSQSVQGKGSLQLSGLDANANYWIETVSTDQVSLKNLAKGQASNALYVNFFAKGSRNGSAYIELQLAEDENGDNQIRSDEDEIYKAKFSVTEDWQQFSIKYDDFELANSAGNGIKEPSKLIKVTLALVSIPAGELVTSNIDFVNFTFNKPFSQK